MIGALQRCSMLVRSSVVLPGGGLGWLVRMGRICARAETSQTATTRPCSATLAWRKISRRRPAAGSPGFSWLIMGAGREGKLQDSCAALQQIERPFQTPQRGRQIGPQLDVQAVGLVDVVQ